MANASVSYTKKVNLPHTELIVGRSGCGKTYYLLRQLESILHHNPGLEKIYIICPTIENNKAFKTWKLPKNLTRKVEYIGCHQDSVNSEIKEIMEVCMKGTEDDVKNIIVLDDCAQGFCVKGGTSPLVSLAFNARHVGVGIIVVTQQLTSISKPYRDNLTRVVTFYTQSKQGTTLMFDEFLGEISGEEKKHLQHTLKTKKYSHMIVELVFPYSFNIIS